MSYEDVLIRESTGEGLGVPEPDDYAEMIEAAENELANEGKSEDD